jgi:hypothetical protein
LRVQTRRGCRKNEVSEIVGVRQRGGEHWAKFEGKERTELVRRPTQPEAVIEVKAERNTIQREREGAAGHGRWGCTWRKVLGGLWGPPGEGW